MAELDHWHPVLTSAELDRKPRGVRLADREIVVFRTTSGGLGALSDSCPHRGMRLSAGWVEGDRLVCGYHGWRWAADGGGEVPATPGARPCARRGDVFHVRERHGALWVKPAEALATFPDLGDGARLPAAVFRHRAAVPFELVLDNLSEVEHAPYVHRFLLGYTWGNRMRDVKPRVFLSDDAVRVVNVDPKALIPWAMAKLVGIPRRAKFTVEWTTRFSPVHSVFHHYFMDPETEQPVGGSVRSAVFFNPVGPESSEIFTFLLGAATPWRTPGLGAVALSVLRAYMNRELTLDMRVLARLADKRGSLAGRTLGRFDGALVAARQRIDRIYRSGPIESA